MVRVGAEVGVVPLFGSVPPVVFWSGAAVAVCQRHMTGNRFSDFIFAF